MFADYQKQVLLTYHEMKAANAISLNLMHATPAKLKRECMAVLSERYEHRQDEKTLSMFFGPRDSAGAYMQAISTVDADKFKPLLTFLRKNIVTTDKKNIELLAWLIDFQPRPFQWDHDYHKVYTTAEAKIGIKEVVDPVLEEKQVKQGEESNEANVADVFGASEEIREDVVVTLPEVAEPTSGSKSPAFASRRRNILVLLLILAISGAGFYITRNRTVDPGIQKCMFWTGDHYQPVSCNQNMDETPVYALDTQKTQRFKKITKPDTLTSRSIGHVWYSKIDGTVEFYTAAGFHPVHTERKLKPMTEFILNKYAKRNPFLQAGNN
ncbi:hypothetical protein [Mucilaginibacter sp. SP1R1]|uniref:hypothetical protein n=1 Tax=Mucilaginibacter sp. SP1R1 TaxID=2723091 RepID=UPI00160BB18B|nr:hypothetical protein [Mucilaginibacter sp. SP1R1]MBB6152377.1 hypothetical protein [Mucilaginibacter sp. SP1R1]